VVLSVSIRSNDATDRCIEDAWNHWQGQTPSGERRQQSPECHRSRYRDTARGWLLLLVDGLVVEKYQTALFQDGRIPIGTPCAAREPATRLLDAGAEIIDARTANQP
jgi:hypothetical protein